MIISIDTIKKIRDSTESPVLSTESSVPKDYVIIIDSRINELIIRENKMMMYLENDSQVLVNSIKSFIYVVSLCQTLKRNLPNWKVSLDAEVTL